jgi:Helicase conserved C-terminal domain
METLRVPSRLDDAVTAAELHRKVMHGMATLDWSQAARVSEAAAAALFRGIALARMPDGFGIDSMPAPIAEWLKAWFERRERGGVAPQKAVLEAPLAARLRERLEDLVRKDLLGPTMPEEEVAEPHVLDRYVVGVLAPRSQVVAPEEMDELDSGGEVSLEDGPVDASAPAGVTMFPSAIGLSFCVAPGTRVRVVASWGRYLRQESQTQRDAEGKPLRVWKRVPMRGEIAPLELLPGPVANVVVSRDQPLVTVRGVVNEARGLLVVSLFLVNGQIEPQARRDEAWLFQPELAVASLDGSAVFLGRALARELGDALPEDEDLAMAMLYRNQVELAVGHGVSVQAEVSAEDPARGYRIATSVMPRFEVGAQRARMPPRFTSEGTSEGMSEGTRESMPEGTRAPEEDARLVGLELDMKRLGELPREAITAALAPMLTAYDAWIAAQRARIGTAAARLDGYEDTAGKALNRCERARARIAQGVARLSEDAQAAEAFRFANRAMWQQRVRSKLVEARRRGDPADLAAFDVPENRTWRTFQLAFVLLNIASLTDITHEDRTDPESAVADLLWFPTGGGKTEAYLGIAAYVMGLRRLQGEVAGRSGEHGVAVLMRYTLRLLTLQQFQRATTLMCACEAIRREALEKGDARWGREPFRVGLWVGARSTPNRTEHADEALKRLRKSGGEPRGGFGGSGSPMQLKSCPWCGTAIEPGRDLRVSAVSGGSGRTLMFCGDLRGGCLFSERRSPDEGLPVLVVDEEIYRRLPTLLIATADKFAQMPWRGEVQMLFGQVDGYCPRHGFRSPEVDDADSHTSNGRLPAVKSVPHGPLRPPDLIIQDELHLISGPLGTLTGLYETAVDELCTWEVSGKRVRPKVIASTATVRRATDQVHALFLRQVEVFPPPGLDASDSFFSIQRSPEEVPGRLYLGICAPGRRQKAVLIRVYLSLLSSAQQLYEDAGRHADPWMTLVGYFGSLRELAGMRRLVDDDVQTRLSRMHRRGLASRRIGEPKELTSRLGSTEIPELLDRLELPFAPTQAAGAPAEDAANEEARGGRGARAARGEARRKRPVDVLLATNMISVGVDVPRLGLMACAGQPKTTAEYIQATSRVGRASPGLVCTLYNWARPRDLSHYETFAHYHATFYQHVEALSVTPFAPRAMDRGLAALLVSLVRLTGSRFNANGAAGAMDPKDPTVARAVEVIARRAEAVEESKALGEQVRKLLVSRLQQWSAEASPKPGKPRLGYKAVRDGVTREMLKPAGLGAWEPFTCLNSLRDVEPTVGLVLEDGGLDDDPPPRGAAAEGGAT